MTTGIQANGTDLDSLFLPLEGTKRADVNIDSNGGVDISNRFEPIDDGTPIANTGIQSGGVDIATLFRDINEPVEKIGEDWLDAAVSLTDSSTEEATPAGITLQFKDNGLYDEERLAGSDNLNLKWNQKTPPDNTYYIKWLKTGGVLSVQPSSGFTENVYKAMDALDELEMHPSWQSGFQSCTIDVWIATSAAGAGAVKKTYTCNVEWSNL